MKLLRINDENIENILLQFEADRGNAISDSLSKLFDSLSDNENKCEVAIKVAALNTLYSTAIQYINPVVEKIASEVDNSHTLFSLEKYVAKVDQISLIQWKNLSTGKAHKRCNMSFSSKYIHFLSKRQVPIYDSYIWIMMIGYMMQNDKNARSFAPPKTYGDFYKVFCDFKDQFKLHHYLNYDIDKYLWQYGKNLLTEIMKEKAIDLDHAKRELKNRIIRG